MMKWLAPLIVITATYLLAINSNAENICAKTLTAKKVEAPQELLWRFAPNKRQAKDYMALSYPNQSGGFSKSSPAREREIKNASLYIKRFIYIDDNEATGMSLFPEVGSKLTLIEPWGDYGSGQLPLFKARRIAPGGILRASLVLPVSGRYGQETTLEWAKNDDITIYMLDKNDNQTMLIDKARSLDITTVQELEIPLKKNEEVRIFYDRSGSAGPHGFPEGRIIRIKWDGTLK